MRTFFLSLLSLAVCLPSLEAAAGPTRPFVLITARELAALRTELAQKGWKWQLYHGEREFEVFASGQGIRSNADLWLNREIRIPAYGGHFHFFFCDDGDQLEFPKGQQFVPGPYRCPKCGRLYRGEQYEGAVRRMIHGFLAQAARDLALVSQLEGKPEYAAKATEILLKYAAAYPGPHTSSTKGGMIFQSLDEAIWVIPLAQAYDLVYAQVHPDARAKIEGFLHSVARGIQNCGVAGNWGSWHLSAVGVVGYAIADQELIGWATANFHRQIRDELGDDGLWPESVHTYHFFPMLAFLYFAEAARNAGADLYHWEGKPGKSLLSMFRAPLQYAYPDLRLPAINDGWFESYLPPDAYELGYVRTGRPEFAWVPAASYESGRVKRNGFWAFLFGKELSSAKLLGRNLQAVSANFPVLGIATLRSGNAAMMTFHYGPFKGHGHLDKMSVTLFANQKLWAADYGTPGYGSAILPWYQGTASHNTVFVDGRNQARTQEDAAQIWLGDSTLEAVRSTTTHAYPGITYSRTVVRVRDYFIVRDQLQSQREHTYEFRFHSEGRFSWLGGSNPMRPAAALRRIEQLSQGEPRKELAGCWQDGQAGLAIWISGAQPMVPLLGKCPAESASRQVDLLIARQQGKTAEFVAVLVPYTKKRDFEARRDGKDVIVAGSSCEDHITFSQTTGRPGIRTKR